METRNLNISFKVHANASALTDADNDLVVRARELSATAYAPYSGFRVCAVARMQDDKLVMGTNQENASYPIGICAERVLLAAVSSIAPGLPIETMAITYQSDTVDTTEPIAPCGMCRQALVEFESRFNQPMRLLLTGSSGEVFEFETPADLLPMAFKHYHLGK